MATLAHIVVSRFKAALEGLDSDPAVETVMAGIALLIAQPLIAAKQFYDEKEIKKFLHLRRGFHGAFTAACAKLADDLEAGTHGPGAVAAAPTLRTISKMPVTQERQALVQVARVLKTFRHIQWEEASPIVHRLIRQAARIASEGEKEKKYSDDHLDFFKDLLKLEVVPTPIKTFLRKVMHLGVSGEGSRASLHLSPHENDNPGAWFEMTPEEKAQARQKVLDAEAVFSQDHASKTPEELQEVVRAAHDTLREVQRQVGVNLDIVKRDEAPKEDLASVLRRESKMEMDGGSLFILQEVIKVFERDAKYEVYQGKPYPKEKFDETSMPIPRDAGKLLTLLRKAKTMDTAKRIIQEASERGLVSKFLVKDLQGTFAKLDSNKAIHDGVPLVPLHFEPMTVDQFRAAHDTGDVELPHGMPEAESQELLGKVSRAITDLEGVFGKGFCGKHKRKLAFRFGGSTGFMTKAHYFAWDDRQEWQPRVTFGEDYEGVLAHELSHYFEDLIAYRIDEKKYEAEGTKTPYTMSGGPGDLFGRASAAWFTENYAKSVDTKWKNDLRGMLPEAAEVMTAVVATPDYARWGDKITNQHLTYMDDAVKNLTGMSVYDLPKDHPYAIAKDAGWEGKTYKSQFPPELIKETERLYKKAMNGDDRRLGYYQGAGEVWARMCEQYVYTKLSRKGVVNPWLTWLTYNDDTYIEQARFEKEIEPIFERLFAKLGTKNILASILARFAR